MKKYMYLKETDIEQLHLAIEKEAEVGDYVLILNHLYSQLNDKVFKVTKTEMKDTPKGMLKFITFYSEEDEKEFSTPYKEGDFGPFYLTFEKTDYFKHETRLYQKENSELNIDDTILIINAENNCDYENGDIFTVIEISERASVVKIVDKAGEENWIEKEEYSKIGEVTANEVINKNREKIANFIKDLKEIKPEKRKMIESVKKAQKILV